MVLSPKFIEKARRELGEDEDRKQRYLYLFRKWVESHTFIKKCRRDDSFLLQFLRIRKFNIENAFESFEKFFLFRKKYEKWCNIDDDGMKRLWELYDLGYAYPLMERDDEGKRIIFLQTRKLDTEKFNSADALRLLGVIVTTLMEEEETQICGISTISDFTDVSFNYFKLFSIRDIKDFADCAKNATVGREKENYFVNLPKFASFLFEIGKKALSEKLRQRLIQTQDMNHLKKLIKPELLPKEYGGIVSEAAMMKNFKNFYFTHQEKILAIKNFEIDRNEIETKENCAVM